MSKEQCVDWQHSGAEAVQKVPASVGVADFHRWDREATQRNHLIVMVTARQLTLFECAWPNVCLV